MGELFRLAKSDDGRHPLASHQMSTHSPKAQDMLHSMDICLHSTCVTSD